MKKQQKQSQQIARIIERQQIISYKRKPTKISKQSDDDIESAHSLKSGVYSEDSVRFSKKNTPLPELGRQKKKMISRNIAPAMASHQINNYLDKQVRQHDNLVLKQKNNHLTSENMKLKTRVMALQKENSRLTKIIQQDGNKIKQPGFHSKDNKFKGSQNISLKMAIKNLRKQLDDQKKQNQKIKWSIKFTRISQLQCERDAILAQTARLRQIIEEEQIRKMTNKHKQQGLSHLEHKVHNLTDKNMLLIRQNNQLQNKLKKVDEFSKKSKQGSENEKNLNRMLFNAKRVIKQKQKQIETLRMQSSTEAKIQSLNSINTTEVKSVKQVGQKNYLNRNKNKQKRVMSKSAQKYRKNASSQGQGCQNCQKLKQQNGVLQKKIEDLTLELKKQKQSNATKGLGNFRRQEIQAPKQQQIKQVSRFLTFRFKAHHLSLDQAQRYLINSELSEKTLTEDISVLQIAQSLVAQPFSIISSAYLQICLIKLFYCEQCDSNNKIKIQQQKKLKKADIIKNFRAMIQTFEIMPQQKQEQMFIQIAQLVTNYHQHILTALNRKKNGQGTISQGQLCSFFTQIQLEKQFVDFIICQIILESLDLQHLNYYTMFEIFYMPNQMPQQQTGAVGPDQPNKKKFQVDHSQIVKQEDEQYEQSRSYVQAKQKTQSRRDDDELDLDDNHFEREQSRIKQIQRNEQVNRDEKIQQDQYEQGQFNEDMQQIVEQKNENIKQDNKNQENEQYEQYFQEQKMEQLPEQQKANEQEVQDEMKPYMMEEVMDEYQDDSHK